MARIGLSQANTLRSNNTTSTGYGIVYADEISGHRSVANLDALYALNAWQLSISGDNTGNDAIGQQWYVVDADGKGTGKHYELINWDKRGTADGWKVVGSGVSSDVTAAINTAVNAEATRAKAAEAANTKAIADNLTTAKAYTDTETTNRRSAINAVYGEDPGDTPAHTIKGNADDLAAEITRAKAAEKVNADKNTAQDTSIKALQDGKVNTADLVEITADEVTAMFN